MPAKRLRSNSPRSKKALALTSRFKDKNYRDGFVAARARRFVASQVREIRGELSQAEFGNLLDKPQSVVSRLEDPNYGKWTVQTLLDVASKVDRALLVQFVSWEKYAEFVTEQDSYLAPPSAHAEPDPSVECIYSNWHDGQQLNSSNPIIGCAPSRRFYWRLLIENKHLYNKECTGDQSIDYQVNESLLNTTKCSVFEQYERLN